MIDPKSFRILHNFDALIKYKLFAFYKPPFAPMRRQDSFDNVTQVSAESFLCAALKSEELSPTLERLVDPAATGTLDSPVPVCVLNDISTLGSGVVMVSLSSLPLNLSHCMFDYEVLVHGHLTKGAPHDPQPVALEELFSATAFSASMGAKRQRATVRLRQLGYYAGHPVSLLHFIFFSPPSARVPSLEGYVRKTFDTFVVGDPLTNASVPYTANLVGDVDFPRVFSNLRRVVYDPATASDVEHSSSVNRVDEAGRTATVYACSGSFSGLLTTERGLGPRSRISLLDGLWTPNVT